MPHLNCAAMLPGICLPGMIGYFGFLRATGNFHEVVPGQIYRAAQMDGQALARWTREHVIASVLNLRGQNDDEDWYETGRAVADRLNIRNIDFRMPASNRLDRAEAQRLIQTMRDAPKPMLIHCMGRADRTGLAAALYVAGIAGQARMRPNASFR